MLLPQPSENHTTMLGFQGCVLEVQPGSTQQASLSLEPSVILSETYPFHIPKVIKHLSRWAVGTDRNKTNPYFP